MPRPKELAPVRWAYDLLNTPFSPRENPLPRPVAGIQDSPYVCVRINLDWLPHLMGFLAAGLQLDAWLGDDDGFSGRQEIHKLLSAMFDLTACVLMTEDTLLRQNPSNKCQLQQSQDGGLSWSLAFDYSLCRNMSLEFNTEQAVNNTFNEWNNTTTNTEINNYAPTTTYRSTTGDSTNRLNARDKALCYAVKTYVDLYCEAQKRLNNEPNIALNIVAAALGIASAVAGALSGGVILPAALGISAGVIGLFGTGFTIANAVLDDVNARKELACCAYKKIRDLAPTEANFKTMASGGCTPALSANAELIRQGLNGTINQANSGDQFHSFINLLGEGTRLAELGLIGECDLCIVPCTLYNFRTGQNGFSVVVGGVPNVARGAYTGGTGFTQVNPNTYREVRFQNTGFAVTAGKVFKIRGTVTGSGGDTCVVNVTAAGVGQSTSPAIATIGTFELVGTFSTTGTGLRIDIVDANTPYNITAITVNELEIC